MKLPGTLSSNGPVRRSVLEALAEDVVAGRELEQAVEGDERDHRAERDQHRPAGAALDQEPVLERRAEQDEAAERQGAAVGAGGILGEAR